MSSVISDNSRRSAFNKHELTEMHARIDAIDELRVRIGRLRRRNRVSRMLKSGKIKKVWVVRDAELFGQQVCVSRSGLYVTAEDGHLHEVRLHRVDVLPNRHDKTIGAYDLRLIARAL